MERALPPGLYGADEIEVGDNIDCGSLVVTAEMIDGFAALTGDAFEIHMSVEAAERHGFTGRVAHGLLVLSLVDGMKNQAAAQLKARASMGWDWTFRAPVIAGDRIFCALHLAEKAPAKTDGQAVLTLTFTVTNEAGKTVQDGQNKLLAYR